MMMNRCRPEQALFPERRDVHASQPGLTPCLLLGPFQVFDPDRIVFLNDVLFCANDVLRLALHQADLACGLDLMFNYWHGWLFYDFWWVAGLLAALLHAGASIQPRACMALLPAAIARLTRAAALLPQGDEGRGGRPRQGQASLLQPPAFRGARQAGPAAACAVSRCS
jgi:hypothetical protein